MTSPPASLSPASLSPASLSIVMLTLNEAHNLPGVLENVADLGAEIFVVDSYSVDDTVGIALAHGAHVVQRRFTGFGEQWNFALETLPIRTPWTMKLDPDERLDDRLKASIRDVTSEKNGSATDGYEIVRRLWFMGRPLPVRQSNLRLWRTGLCRFTDAAVNEHAVVEGPVGRLQGEMAHHDSPSLHHWLDKQNRYSTAQAIARFEGAALPVRPRALGSRIERRAWLRELFWRLPGRFVLLHLWLLFGEGAWRAGMAGRAWARLRVERYRAEQLKLREMRMAGRVLPVPPSGTGPADPRLTPSAPAEPGLDDGAS